MIEFEKSTKTVWVLYHCSGSDEPMLLGNYDSAFGARFSARLHLHIKKEACVHYWVQNTLHYSTKRGKSKFIVKEVEVAFTL